MSESGYIEKKTDIDSAAVLELNEDGSPVDTQKIKKNCLMLPRTLKMKKPGNTGEQSPASYSDSSNESDTDI